MLDRNLATPPGSPTDGQRWIVAASPTGAWSGHATEIAAWQDGAWRFFAPRTGWLAYVVDEGAAHRLERHRLGRRLVDADGDPESLAARRRHHGRRDQSVQRQAQQRLVAAKTVAEGGDGHLRYKLSKESAAKTLSLLMQTNFSGRAEIGLTGDDDLHVKVSPDGSTWFEGWSIARAGQVRLGIDGTRSAALPSRRHRQWRYRIGANNGRCRWAAPRRRSFGLGGGRC